MVTEVTRDFPITGGKRRGEEVIQKNEIQFCIWHSVRIRRKHVAGWKPNNRVDPGSGPVGSLVSRGDDGRRERGDGALGAAGDRPSHRGRLCPLRDVRGLGCERSVPGRGSALRGTARRWNRALRTSSPPR